MSPSLEMGRAAEYLVCADLILAGFPAYPAAPGLAYDLVVDVSGRLLRLQVKSTLQPLPVPQRAVRVDAYMFHVKRCGRGGNKAYQASEFDGYALVALDRRLIAYLPFDVCKTSIVLRLPGVEPRKGCARKETIADFPWEDFLKRFDS